MSMGGDFYALSDDQLTRLLKGALNHEGFLHAGPGEQPRESLTKFEHLWYELSQVLAEEQGCGAAQSEIIPQLCSFSTSKEVAETARMLEKLDEPAVLARCGQAGVEAPAAEVWGAVKEVIAFYRRAAENKDAVLFRVT